MAIVRYSFLTFQASNHSRLRVGSKARNVPQVPPTMARLTWQSGLLQRHPCVITKALGITAPEDRLKMRPDITMVDLTTNDLSSIKNRAPKKRKADGEQATIKDMIGRKKITILEIEYVADSRYEDKYKAKVQQHKCLCWILEKEGHEVKLYPIILGTQESVFDCFKAAMLAAGVRSPQKMVLARELHHHAVTSLSKIIRSRRFLEYQVLKCKTKKPPDRH